MGELIGSEGDFEYRVLTPDVAEEATTLVSQVFAERAPLSSYLRIPAEFILQFTRVLITQPTGEGLSIVAIHQPTREVCGALLNEKHTAEEAPPPCVPEVIEAFADIATLLGSVTEGQHEEFSIDSESVFHQVMFAVPEQWKGHNIGLNLMKFSLVLAQKQGFKFAVVELTSPISRHLCIDKLGYTATREIVYDDFENEGRKPFEHLAGSITAAFIAIDSAMH